jgi:hypothetical protein
MGELNAGGGMSLQNLATPSSMIPWAPASHRRLWCCWPIRKVVRRERGLARDFCFISN